MTQEIDTIIETIKATDVKTGYRDVYWCWAINEPTISKTDQYGDIRCGECRDLVDDGNYKHTFVCHILKGNPATQ